MLEASTLAVHVVCGFVAAGVGLLAVGGTRLAAGVERGRGRDARRRRGPDRAPGGPRIARGDAESRARFVEHFSRTGAGYVATVTAFPSVNVTLPPPVARWRWPTVRGAPLLVSLTRRYGRRVEAGDA
jgi:hypothetical protein